MMLLPICEPCVAGEGSECHTPECALFLRDVPEDGLIAEFAQRGRTDGIAEALALLKAARGADMIDSKGVRRIWISERRLAIVVALLEEDAEAPA